MDLISKEGQLWQACTDGNLEVVKELSHLANIDMNWSDPEGARTPFYRACSHNRASVVEYLLKDPRIDVNKTQRQQGTAVNVACQDNFLEVVTMLVKDKRCDIDIVDMYGAGPLWVCAQYGFVELVKVMLLHRPRAKLSLRTVAGPSGWCNKTAKEIADLKGHVVVRDILVEFEQDPEEAHQRLRIEFHVPGLFNLSFLLFFFLLFFFLLFFFAFLLLLLWSLMTTMIQYRGTSC
jgi:ankyrin repeat protein